MASRDTRVCLKKRIKYAQCQNQIKNHESFNKLFFDQNPLNKNHFDTFCHACWHK